MHLIRVAERLGGSSQRPRGSTLALCLCTGPYKHIRPHNSRLCMITGTSKTIDERRHVIDHTAPVVAQRRACATPVSMQNGATVGARLSPPRVHSRTAGPAQKTSTTLSMYCNWRNAMVTGPRESASAPRKECRQPGPSTNKTSCTVGSRLFPTTAHDQLDLHRNIDHLVNVL